MKDQLFITPKEIQYLTGMSRRYSYDCMRKMREFYGKSKHQKITVTEFCLFIGVGEDLVRMKLL